MTGSDLGGVAKWVDASGLGEGLGLSSEIGAGRCGAVAARIRNAIRHRLVSFMIRNALFILDQTG